jgi:hypothetical protein
MKKVIQKLSTAQRFELEMGKKFHDFFKLRWTMPVYRDKHIHRTKYVEDEIAYYLGNLWYPKKPNPMTAMYNAYEAFKLGRDLYVQAKDRLFKEYIFSAKPEPNNESLCRAVAAHLELEPRYGASVFEEVSPEEYTESVLIYFLKYRGHGNMVSFLNELAATTKKMKAQELITSRARRMPYIGALDESEFEEFLKIEIAKSNKVPVQLAIPW